MITGDELEALTRHACIALAMHHPDCPADWREHDSLDYRRQLAGAALVHIDGDRFIVTIAEHVLTIPTDAVARLVGQAIATDRSPSS